MSIIKKGQQTMLELSYSTKMMCQHLWL